MSNELFNMRHKIIDLTAQHYVQELDKVVHPTAIVEPGHMHGFLIFHNDPNNVDDHKHLFCGPFDEAESLAALTLLEETINRLNITKYTIMPICVAKNPIGMCGLLAALKLKGKA